MKQEEKDLLLRDLCARLPHGVKVQDRNGTHTLTNGNTEFTDLFSGKCNIKPYLRPMSSMTDEEKQELYAWGDYEEISWISDEEICFKDLVLLYELLTKLTDWLNKHHFDYRGLIEKGLAIEAPSGMYDDK